MTGPRYTSTREDGRIRGLVVSKTRCLHASLSSLLIDPPSSTVLVGGIHSRFPNHGNRLATLSNGEPGELQRGHAMPTTRNAHQVFQILPRGVIVGLIGGVLMALFAMIASATYMQMGFFTPLYAVATPLIGQQPLLTSIRDGIFYLAFSPALLGLMIHLLWSALWGLIFGLLAHRLHLTGGGAIIGGLVYGVLVMLVMFFIVLPFVGASSLLRVLGGWSFSLIIAHALFYGLPLGLWPVLQPQLFTDLSARQAV